jgi:hypothetical protein
MEACCAWDLAVGCTWIRRLKTCHYHFAFRARFDGCWAKELGVLNAAGRIWSSMLIWMLGGDSGNFGVVLFGRRLSLLDSQDDTPAGTRATGGRGGDETVSRVVPRESQPESGSSMEETLELTDARGGLCLCRLVESPFLVLLQDLQDRQGRMLFQVQQCRKSSSFRPTSKDGHEEVGVHNPIVWRTGNENLEPYDSSLYLPILADTPRINIGLSWPSPFVIPRKKL